MAKAVPYLFFDGNCVEAFNFYKDALGGELSIQMVSEIPGAPPLEEGAKDSVMHAAISKGNLWIFGSDIAMSGLEYKQGNSLDVCLVCDSKEELESAFKNLSEGGIIGNEITEEFFGTYADLTDKFGMRWMLQYGQNGSKNE